MSQYYYTSQRVKGSYDPNSEKSFKPIPPFY